MALLTSFDKRRPMSGAEQEDVASGQRKLFVGLVQFLTNHWIPQVPPQPTSLIYVDAAPGTNLLLVSRMFPALTFELYDTRPFDAALSDVPNVKIHNRKFQEQDFKMSAGSTVLFYSDIKSEIKTGSLEYEAANEKILEESMEMQLRWITAIQPAVASLKFKVPWFATKGKFFTYPSGYVYKQPWITGGSEETRLVCTPPFTLRDYDITTYHEQLSHHNNVVRAGYTYLNQFTGDKTPYGKDNTLPSGLGFDSSYEVSVLLRWSQKMGWPQGDQDTFKRLTNFRTQLGSMFGSPVATVRDTGAIMGELGRINIKASHEKDIRNSITKVTQGIKDVVTKIFDATGGSGLESIFLSRVFPKAKVYAMEIDTKRYEDMKTFFAQQTESKNLNALLGDSIKHLLGKERPEYDIILFDPLWQDRKEGKDGDYYMSGMPLVKIIKDILEYRGQTKLILFQVQKDYFLLDAGRTILSDKTGRPIGKINKPRWNIGEDYDILAIWPWKEHGR